MTEQEIRAAHPDWSGDQIVCEVARLVSRVPAPLAPSMMGASATSAVGEDTKDVLGAARRSRRTVVSNRIHLRRARLAGLALTGSLVLSPLLAGSAFAASPVPLGTAESFALLAGSTITNTGPTTITGDIGLCCTGLATPGFDSVTQPGGTQYVGTNGVAATAQDDLDIAYDNAAGQAVTNIVGVDLSLAGTPANPLRPGVYQSTSRGSLQINTGLTLDFQNNPNAVFIFQGTDLVTAAGPLGSVHIVNGGASPSSCNIYWQLSTDAQGVTLGTNSAFKGTTMALGASSLGTGATVDGRILTRRSKDVTMDTNTITRSACRTVTEPTPTPTPTPGTTPPSNPTRGPANNAPAASTSTLLTRNGTARLRRSRRSTSREGFTATVRGRQLKRVVFWLDGKRVATRSGSPFKMRVPARPGKHRLTARVTFKDATRAKTLKLRYRISASALLQPRGGPSRFTG